MDPNIIINNNNNNDNDNEKSDDDSFDSSDDELTLRQIMMMKKKKKKKRREDDNRTFIHNNDDAGFDSSDDDDSDDDELPIRQMMKKRREQRKKRQESTMTSSSHEKNDVGNQSERIQNQKVEKHIHHDITERSTIAKTTTKVNATTAETKTNNNNNNNMIDTDSVMNNTLPSQSDNNVIKHQVFDKSHKCDICNIHDGYENMNMQQCKSCKIYVHEQCYCLFNPNTNNVNNANENNHNIKKYTNWQCFACAAVGNKITITEHLLKDKIQRREITIQQRPMKCALCSYNHDSHSSNNAALHAMHPLYDKCGQDGQPKVRGNETLWVHTLCAFSVNTSPWSNGLLYGCDEKNNPINEDSDDDDDDDDNKSDHDQQKFYNFNCYGNQQNIVLAPTVHHFVITSKDDNASDISLKTLKEHRGLICIVCKKGDKSSTRIPIQVS